MSQYWQTIRLEGEVFGLDYLLTKTGLWSIPEVKKGTPGLDEQKGGREFLAVFDACGYRICVMLFTMKEKGFMIDDFVK